MMSVFVTYVVLLAIGGYAQVTRGASSRAIVDSLLADYNRDEPPPTGNGTTVEIGLYVHSMELRTKGMEMSLSVYLRQRWTDSRLRTRQAGSAANIRLQSNATNRIWMPDTFIRNLVCVDAFQHVFESKFLTLSESGVVWYVTKLKLTTSCPMDLKSFPFDRQTCSVFFESFGYTADVLKLKSLETPIELDSSTITSDWTVTDRTVQDCTKTYQTGTYPCLQLQLTAKRNHSHYVMTTYLPSMLLVILSWLPFWLVDTNMATVRVLLGLVPLWGVIALGKLTSLGLPHISYVTAMDVWIGACASFAFASILEFGVVAAVGQLLEKKMAADSCLGKSEASSDVKKDASKIDVVSRVCFPVVFLLFNIVYWSVYAG
jgi:cation transporter family protein